MSLNEVWDTASQSPFHPVVAKNRQFFVGFFLLFVALVFTSFFGLDRSFKNIVLFGFPASLAFGFGAVYTINALGVYV